MKRVPTWVTVLLVLVTIGLSRYQSPRVAYSEALFAGTNNIFLDEVFNQEFKEMHSSKFIATGYSIGKPYSTITRSGEPLINMGFMNVGGIHIMTVAVDPKIVPLGSILYIEGVGLGLAMDTGRAIKGKKIDICFQDMIAAMNWGKRDVQVYMLRKGQ